MAENFQNMTKHINVYMQKPQRLTGMNRALSSIPVLEKEKNTNKTRKHQETPRRIKAQRFTRRHIIDKMLEANDGDKKKIMEARSKTKDLPYTSEPPTDQ